MNKGQALLWIQNCNIFGQAKASRVQGYFTEVFRQDPDADVTEAQILEMAKNSRQDITKLRHNLVAKRKKK